MASSPHLSPLQIHKGAKWLEEHTRIISGSPEAGDSLCEYIGSGLNDASLAVLLQCTKVQALRLRKKLRGNLAPTVKLKRCDNSAIHALHVETSITLNRLALLVAELAEGLGDKDRGEIARRLAAVALTASQEKEPPSHG